MKLKKLLSGIFGTRKTALVLGGGSARGLAHIGIIKVLQRENITFDMVVGTSIGAFMGAHYALGKDVSEAEKLALSFKSREVLDIMIPPSMGLIKGERVYAVIKQILGDAKFADTKIPLAVVATDIENGKEVVFTEGNLANAVRVSCSYPGIFAPQRIDGKLLVDGGIINTVPVTVARRMGADIVVAADVGFCVQPGQIKNIFGVILQPFQIVGDELNKYQSMDANIVIRPSLEGITQVDFDNSKLIIQRGEIAAWEKIKKIKKKLRIN